MEILGRLARKRPDLTLAQLREAGGWRCSLSMLWRGLRQLGLTSKKKTLRAEEQDDPDAA